MLHCYCSIIFQTTDAISQTELEETKDIATMDRDVMFSEGVERKRCVSPPTVGISEAECQERVQQAVTEVSERLDLLYGEEKSKALKELSDRVRIYCLVSCTWLDLFMCIGSGQ